MFEDGDDFEAEELQAAALKAQSEARIRQLRQEREAEAARQRVRAGTG